MFRFLKRILASPGTQQAAQWQPLARTPAQVRAHDQWVAQQVYLNWMGPYFKAYHFRKTGVCGQGLRVQLLEECGRQGALFFFDPSIGPGNFRHLFDFIRDRVLALGYNLSTSDQRTLRHERYIETIDKHFLKPQPKDCTQSGRCNQQFGTVTVDMVSVNGQPGFIRFSANPYHDAIFTPAHSFDALMERVFNLPPAPPEVQSLIRHYAK
ncbi:hypothetical protein SAMN02745146_3240 [Hymenobacter daecheongensis DSM 21074]|uniref:Uncharacterized protein n=1 Tax=Hymenobacter daecheongensis DSM 21074 TaxID=1121955 RepID=A0A1M6JRJ4_9BACT|nr:hypothetical protein [Hymenobacter daecheongensis]SHJ49328.1 hypothetical protein SAMN02745146_3240 [Hymenobacter daecheongensis DSM 21074]